jgi:hypothetical protein
MSFSSSTLQGPAVVQRYTGRLAASMDLYLFDEEYLARLRAP